jgi:fasciclin domain protein
MASGKQLWIYSFRTAFNSVPGTGPEQLFLVSASTQVTSFVASHNIRTQTGIVHSLQYNFRPTDF